MAEGWGGAVGGPPPRAPRRASQGGWDGREFRTAPGVAQPPAARCARGPSSRCRAQRHTARRSPRTWRSESAGHRSESPGPAPATSLAAAPCRPRRTPANPAAVRQSPPGLGHRSPPRNTPERPPKSSRETGQKTLIDQRADSARSGIKHLLSLPSSPLPKLNVAGSIPAGRSIKSSTYGPENSGAGNGREIVGNL